jgi:hypothetical protein
MGPGAAEWQDPLVQAALLPGHPARQALEDGFRADIAASLGIDVSLVQVRFLYLI